MRGDLSTIIKPWLETLDLPSKIYTTTNEELAVRGESHWYTKSRKLKRLVPGIPLKCSEELIEDWVMTVRDRCVEIRHEKDYSLQIIGWDVIDAADPEFFLKLERALRAVLAYLTS